MPCYSTAGLRLKERMRTMLASDRALYRHWIVANGWAESVGLGTTLVSDRTAAPLIEGASGVAAILGGALLAVLLGVLLEGVLVGIAQERVLRQRLVALRPGRWVKATAIGAGLAWLVGMVPSTVMALGFITGPILGVAQWTALRGLVERPARWLWANALAWAIGMPVIFAGMDQVRWNAHAAIVIVSIYAVCGVAGLVAGAIHGCVLVSRLRSARVAD